MFVFWVGGMFGDAPGYQRLGVSLASAFNSNDTHIIIQ